MKKRMSKKMAFDFKNVEILKWVIIALLLLSIIFLSVSLYRVNNINNPISKPSKPSPKPNPISKPISKPRPYIRSKPYGPCNYSQTPCATPGDNPYKHCCKGGLCWEGPGGTFCLDGSNANINNMLCREACEQDDNTTDEACNTNCLNYTGNIGLCKESCDRDNNREECIDNCLNRI